MQDVLSLPRKLLVGATLSAAVACVTPLAAAQQNSAVSGGLAGYVKDPSGAAVPNAKVNLKGPQQTACKVASHAPTREHACLEGPGCAIVEAQAP